MTSESIIKYRRKLSFTSLEIWRGKYWDDLLYVGTVYVDTIYVDFVDSLDTIYVGTNYVGTISAPDPQA